MGHSVQRQRFPNTLRILHLTPCKQKSAPTEVSAPKNANSDCCDTTFDKLQENAKR